MPRAIDRGRAAGHYQDALRDIIHAFKYEGRRSLAKPLAALMHRQAGELLDDVDWIVPVPLHWKRERERGFNQANDLARALIARYRENGPTSTHRPRLLHALRRVRHTTVQAELSAARRHKNVRDAFALSRGFPARRAADALAPKRRRQNVGSAFHFTVARYLTRLRRGDNAARQDELREARRHKNARDAFPGPLSRLRRGEDAARRALGGSCVLLVDDVSTTGATLEACARVLKDAGGVKEVRAITVARVVTRPFR